MASDNERRKRSFRQTKTWKSFRHEIISRDKNDCITGRKLLKGAEVHHEDLNPEHYKNLDADNFIALNKQTHKFLHWIYNYYKTDRNVIVRLVRVLEKMVELNP